MLTNSYLEYFLTLLGWVVNNGLWNILLSTGLFAAPLAFRLIGIWLKIREEGDDEGNKGALSIPRMEHAIYTSFLVMMSCCMPLMNVDLNTIKYDVSRAASCGTGVPNHPDDTGYSAVISSINEQTAAAPVWWYLIHKLAKGITQASVATIPCRPDMRQLRFGVQHTRISNKALAEELQDFTQDCYSLALYMWKRQDQGYTSDKAMLRDIEWIGSRTFLNSYYGGLQSKIPRAEFAWNEARDGGRPETGRGGYPTCREWWSNGETGLEARVIDQANPDLWTRLSAALNMAGGNANDYSEAVIRRLVSPESLTVSQGGHVYAGYGGNADFTLDNTITRLAAIGGTALGSLAAFPAFDNLRQALPMIQAVLLMAIVVMVPLILAFSAYEFKTVITLTFVLFALNFLTFWWELARWLDSWLLTALYSSDTHSRFNMAGFQNSSDDLIMNFVMATMFLVLPAVWMGALSWAGIRVGTTLDGAFKSGSAKVEQSGGEGVNSLKKAGRL